MLSPRDTPPPSSPPPPRVHAACVGVVGGACVALTLLVIRKITVPWFALEAGLILAILAVAVAARSPALRVSLPLGVLPLSYLFFQATLSAMMFPDIAFFWNAGREWLPGIMKMLALRSALAGCLGALFFAAMASTMVHVPSRALHAASVAVLALTTGLVAVSTVRAAREPDPEHHLASLPSLGVIPPVEGEPSLIEKGPPDPSGTPIATRIHDVTIGGLGVRRLCPSLVERCFLDVKHAGEPFDVRLVAWLSQRTSYPAAGDAAACEHQPRWVDPGATLAVREASPLVHEASSLTGRRELDALLVLDGTLHNAPRGGEAGPVVLTPPRFSATAVSMRHLAAMLGAHRRAIAVAACGVILAAALLGHRRRVGSALARIARARVAVLGQDGWLDFADGSPPVRAGDRGLPVGPVVVLEPGSAGAYRGGALPEGGIVAGAQADLLAQGRARIAQIDVVVFFVAVLAALPLLTAAVTLNLW
ncbi:hypothetical protein SOCE26_049010 [Sorangium cellulosum]|uniref:Uncharacterized protein n=1 Tax=Sorangium cellulosum TaxID=56 RepID=A0A2L0EVX0_SORCE|nr:hypothetical protein [Sorangium cellulosum]AUX43453.1 hypothetical protein SOCE26_049010 [Sorangium cellulosum]